MVKRRTLLQALAAVPFAPLLAQAQPQKLLFRTPPVGPYDFVVTLDPPTPTTRALGRGEFETHWIGDEWGNPV